MFFIIATTILSASCLSLSAIAWSNYRDSKNAHELLKNSLELINKQDADLKQIKESYKQAINKQDADLKQIKESYKQAINVLSQQNIKAQKRLQK